MKLLPFITLLLWFAIAFCYLFFRDFLLQPYIKFPVLIALSIFMPVCLWELTTKKNRIYASVFAVLFIFNIAFLSFHAYRTYAYVASLEPYKNQILDRKLAQVLTSEKNEASKIKVAKTLFATHGVALSYKSEDGKAKAIIPSNEDEIAYYTNKMNNTRISLAKKWGMIAIDETLILLAIHVLVFSGLLCFLVIYERPKNLNAAQKSITNRIP